MWDGHWTVECEVFQRVRYSDLHHFSSVVFLLCRSSIARLCKQCLVGLSRVCFAVIGLSWCFLLPSCKMYFKEGQHHTHVTLTSSHSGCTTWCDRNTLDYVWAIHQGHYMPRGQYGSVVYCIHGHDRVLNSEGT